MLRNYRSLPAAVALLAGSAVCLAQAPSVYSIGTFAGNGTAGLSGDSGLATDAELNFPMGISIDSSGNMYIGDVMNHNIRKITTDGKIASVAGSNANGYSGDDDDATDATLSYPCAAVAGSSSGFYIADTGNGVIRKVSSDGKISTFAGTTTIGFYGNGGPATTAHLHGPSALVMDSAGNLYIADTVNNQIRKVGTDGKINAFAGSSNLGYAGDGGAAVNAYLNRPEAIAIDASGNMYIADTGNHRIRKVATDGTITTVAGNGVARFSGDGGLAVNASLYYPQGVAVDSAGYVYISDTYNTRIRVVSPNGLITTIAGNGKFGSYGDGWLATSAALSFPRGIAVGSDGKVYVADHQNSRIRVLTPIQSTSTSAPAAIVAGVTSASAFGPSTAVAPGSWIEIYGSNLASATRQWATADFSGIKAPTSLDGTSVTIGGQAAYLSYISPNQVNALVPQTVTPGEQALVVTTRSGSGGEFILTVQTTQPGLFAPDAFKVAGKQYAAAATSDGSSYILPRASVDMPARPARPGEVVTLYGVGFGAVTPTPGDGEIVQEENSLVLPIEFYFGDTLANVRYAGLAPGNIGLYRFDVIVPAMADDDATPLTFKLGGASSGQTLYTAVRN
jgi:uncharacterized protein (TIGR03437 family)